MFNGLLLLFSPEDVRFGFYWVIVLPILFILFVGIPLYLWSRKREAKKRDEARDRMFNMPLAELQGQNVSLALECRPFRDLLLSPSAVEWLDLLVLRTLQAPDLPGNYSFLVEKYTSILNALVQRLQPWSDAWTAEGSEPIGAIRLRATDAQWASHIAGFNETVGWLAELAAQQSRLAGRIKDFAVPQWDQSILTAHCESVTEGFLRSWILTTGLHGASLAEEINRVSQPLVAPGDLDDSQVALKEAAKGA